jgi:phosphoglycolate phosphatase
VASRFALLILDLDGTLVDSEALLVRQVNDTLTVHGFPLAAPRAVAATIGLPLDEVFRRALPGSDAAAIDALCTHYRARADTAEFVRQFRLYAGVGDTLAALRAVPGLRIVVGTSKGRATTLDILAHCGIAAMIDAVLGGDSVTRGKPHREMVDRARVLFPTPAERTVVVGDTSFDIEMGKGAGAATCAVTYGMHDADRLRDLQPDFLIDRFATVREVVITGALR